MVFADLKGKTHVPEDVLTSNCIGLLSLLNDGYLIDFFSMAITLNGNKLDLSSYDEIVKLDFWPWLPGGGEPDVICILKSRDTKEQIAFIIEVKHGAGKSGYAEDVDHATQDTDSYSSNDQLAKYWLAARKIYKENLVVIYLTHHQHLPKQDIEESLQEIERVEKLTNSGIIYWLSWYHFYQFVTSVPNTGCTAVETKILERLKLYLEQKGYLRFQKWNLPLKATADQVYNNSYDFKLAGCSGLLQPFSRKYFSYVKHLNKSFIFYQQEK